MSVKTIAASPTTYARYLDEVQSNNPNKIDPEKHVLNEFYLMEERDSPLQQDTGFRAFLKSAIDSGVSRSIRGAGDKTLNPEALSTMSRAILSDPKPVITAATAATHNHWLANNPDKVLGQKGDKGTPLFNARAFALPVNEKLEIDFGAYEDRNQIREAAIAFVGDRKEEIEATIRNNNELGVKSALFALDLLANDRGVLVAPETYLKDARKAWEHWKTGSSQVSGQPGSDVVSNDEPISTAKKLISDLLELEKLLSTSEEPSKRSEAQEKFPMAYKLLELNHDAFIGSRLEQGAWIAEEHKVIAAKLSNKDLSIDAGPVIQTLLAFVRLNDQSTGIPGVS